jgi:hypothetical protein
MAKFPDLTGDGEVTQADILKGRGVKAAKKGGLMKKKRYDGGGDVIELESKMGRNENIDDDVRARAMAAMAARETGAEEAEPAKPKAEPKPKPKAKAEPKKKTFSFEGRTSPFAGKTSVFKKMASGGSVSSASKRADGCAIKGKTRGKMV